MHRLLLLVVLLILLCACGGTVASTAPTPTATRAPTPKPTATLTHKGQTITHGTPRIGGPISNFYGKYGQPHNQGIGDSETWIVNQQFLNAGPDVTGKVTQVGISISDTVAANQMIAYCIPFLPPDASKFNTDGGYIDYHSSIGEIVMQIVTSSCTLTLPQS